MQAEQQQTQQDIKNLQSERESLIQKNEHAKSKVEAIIQRLSILGTEQDQHAQEILQLANPSDSSEEV